MPTSEQERRRIVTEDAFRVSPRWLGWKLAPPLRRLLAMAVDLVGVFLLTYTTSVGLALAVFFGCVWIAIRGARDWKFKILRGFAGVLIGFVAFLTVLVLTDDSQYSVPASSWAEFGDAMASSNPEAQQQALEDLGAEMAQIQERQTQELSGLSGAGLLREIDDSKEPAEQNQAEQVEALERYLEALSVEQSVGLEALRQEAQSAVAGREIHRLEQQIRQGRDERLQLVQENQELRLALDDPSLVRTARALASDAGLGLGWAAVYFIFFPALFRGRTPGKRIFGLRVIRLDGQPFSVWNAFERFGGYAAGFATGLLGFLQIFWDDNRQAVHDKIVGTVVVVQGAKPPR